MDEEKWDLRYLKLAKLVAGWSKDPNAKVGAVIVRNNRVVATGFNGLPSDVLDSDARLQDQEVKLQMTVHAEENALIVAGPRVEGATIYVHGKPVCPRCAASLIQAGVSRVVAAKPEANSQSKWDKLGDLALEMFLEKGVRFHNKRIEAGSRQSVQKSSAKNPTLSNSRNGHAHGNGQIIQTGGSNAP